MNGWMNNVKKHIKSLWKHSTISTQIWSQKVSPTNANNSVVQFIIYLVARTRKKIVRFIIIIAKQSDGKNVLTIR